MKIATLVGILLIILGIVSLVFQSITYKTDKNVINLGPIHAEEETKKQIPLPPILGGISLVGGIALVAVGSRKRA